MGRYFNIDGEPIDLFEWAEAGITQIGDDRVGDVRVSTVLLGLDHSHGDGPPLIFETMVFGYGEDRGEYQWRYSTKEQALAGHAAVLAAVRDESLTPELSVAS